MTPEFSCVRCHRVVSSDSGKCPVCSGNRLHMDAALKICATNKCGHMVPCASGGIGCDLHPNKPGHIRNHLLSGGGCMSYYPMFGRYEGEPKKPKRSGRIVKVELPRVDIEPMQSDRVVVMVAPGKDYEQQASITAPLAKQYAERIGADFRLLTGDLHPSWPMGNKYRFLPYAKAYSRSLFVDCDVIVRPDAPDVFDHVPPDSFGVFDETDQLDTHCGLEWVEREGRELCRSQRIRQPGEFWMFNAGVLVASPQVAHLYDPPKRPLRTYWCAEQQWLTLRIQTEKANWTSLDERFNWTFVRPDFWLNMESAWFIHCNGSKPQAYRMELLKRLAVGNFERIGLPPSDWQPRWL